MNIINRIFNDFEESCIKYCHFKSNQHLKESFDGDADFDILVDRTMKNECTKLLLENGCKQFEPTQIGAYPGVENWLAYDESSGVIYHIHLHYQLITGKSLVKDYVLPWQDITLLTAKKSIDYNIFISDPNFEIVLLMTRLVLKGKFKHFISSIFGTYKMPRDMQVEFDYLKERIEHDKILEVTYELFSPKVAKKISETIIEHTTVDSKTYFNLNSSIRKDLKDNRRTTSINGLLLSKYNRGIDLFKKLLNRKFNQPHITKKITSSGGKIITFIGVDGSGKSTVSDVMVKWLGRKTECKKIYMGTGDGKKNIFAAFITILKRLSKNRNKKEKIISSIKEIKFTSAPINYIKKYIHALVIYSVVRDNRKKILKMQRYRLNGGISILDRFPQLEQENINDGLKLSRYAQMLNSKFLTRLANKERELMSIVDTIYPDIVFRLKISPELSMLRKPEEHHDFDAIKFKTESVNMLKFEKSLVYDIDASKDFSREILDIKKIIWENL